MLASAHPSSSSKSYSHLDELEGSGHAHARKTTSRVSAQLRLAAAAVGRTNTALGVFYRRLAARTGKAKAVTATARKIAVLFYNAVRLGRHYQDPGADTYELRYRQRVIQQLHRRAAEFGFTLQHAPAGVFLRKTAQPDRARRGIQYAAEACRQLLATANIIPSMRRNGNC
jgi:hypothetical protein